MSDGIVRWATAADDAALRRLCKRVSITGPISYCLEREPEFFALTRMQGDTGGRVAVIDHGDEIVAMAAIATQRVWLGGKRRHVAYLGDLKVDPSHRGRGLAGNIIQFLQAQLDRLGIERSYFLVLAGNPAFANVSEEADKLYARNVRRIRNYLVLLSPRKRRVPDVAVRPSTSEDAREMAVLWNRVNRHKTYAPVADVRAFHENETFRVATRNGRIVGFCSVWDASPVKQIRLLKLSRALIAAKTIYDVGARIRRRASLPGAGELLRFLYVRRVCAESPAVLDSLLDAIDDEYADREYLYFDIALDHDDALTCSLQHRPSMKVDFDLWEAFTPSHRHVAAANAAAPAYFDMSLV